MALHINKQGEMVDTQEVEEIVEIIKQLKTTKDLHCVIKDFSYNVDNVADEQYLDVENFQLVHKYEEGDDSSEVIVSINNDKSIKEVNIIDKTLYPFISYNTSTGILKVLVHGTKGLEIIVDSETQTIVPKKARQIKDILQSVLIQQAA